jgi:hypothetical protein
MATNHKINVAKHHADKLGQEQAKQSCNDKELGSFPCHPMTTTVGNHG